MTLGTNYGLKGGLLTEISRGLGHLGCQFGKALGLVVVGIDARDEALDLAKECGANLVVDARQGKEKVVAEVHKVTNGVGCDAVLNLSDADEAASLACAITKMHGLMIQIAQVYYLLSHLIPCIFPMPLHPFFPHHSAPTSLASCLANIQPPFHPLQPPNISIPFAELIFRDIRVHGSLICSPAQAREMLDVVAAHDIKVKANTFYGLREIPKMMELAQGEDGGEGVVVVSEEELKRGEGRG